MTSQPAQKYSFVEVTDLEHTLSTVDNNHTSRNDYLVAVGNNGEAHLVKMLNRHAKVPTNEASTSSAQNSARSEGSDTSQQPHQQTKLNLQQSNTQNAKPKPKQGASTAKKPPGKKGLNRGGKKSFKRTLKNTKKNNGR